MSMASNWVWCLILMLIFLTVPEISCTVYAWTIVRLRSNESSVLRCLILVAKKSFSWLTNMWFEQFIVPGMPIDMAPKTHLGKNSKVSCLFQMPNIPRIMKKIFHFLQEDGQSGGSFTVGIILKVVLPEYIGLFLHWREIWSIRLHTEMNLRHQPLQWKIAMFNTFLFTNINTV